MPRDTVSNDTEFLGVLHVHDFWESFESAAQAQATERPNSCPYFTELHRNLPRTQLNVIAYHWRAVLR